MIEILLIIIERYEGIISQRIQGVDVKVLEEWTARRQ